MTRRAALVAFRFPSEMVAWSLLGLGGSDQLSCLLPFLSFSFGQPVSPSLSSPSLLSSTRSFMFLMLHERIAEGVQHINGRASLFFSFLFSFYSFSPSSLLLLSIYLLNCICFRTRDTLGKKHVDVPLPGI